MDEKIWELIENLYKICKKYDLLDIVITGSLVHGSKKYSDIDVKAFLSSSDYSFLQLLIIII